MDRLTGVGNEPPPKGDKTGIPRFSRKNREEGREEGCTAARIIKRAVGRPSRRMGEIVDAAATAFAAAAAVTFIHFGNGQRKEEQRRRRKNNLAFELVSLFPSFFFPSLPAR